MVVEATGCLVFKHFPLLNGRQVVQDLPSFTHAQFLHFPSPLQRQQTTILLLYAFEDAQGEFFLVPLVSVLLSFQG